MGKGNNRTRSLKNIIDVGERMQEDMEEVKRRAEEGYHQERLRRGPLDGLSDYARKKRLQASASVASEVSVQPVEVESNGLNTSAGIYPNYHKGFPKFREAHYVFLPDGKFEKPKERYGLIILNYVFKEDNGYRYAFNPQRLKSFNEFENFVAIRSHCHKLPEPVVINKGQDFYLNEAREIVLGDRHDPRLHDLTLVEKLS
ncbi:MAG: hypothetical protein Q7R87_00290 [Nanoarchaeota archaeon]|nr:hypothetical protein [Nanoarchaeota archaeon]